MRAACAIATQRLVLRSLEAAHAHGPYLGWLRDPEVLRFLEARFVRHEIATLEGFIASCNASEDTLLLGLFRKSDDTHIGNVKLGPIDRNHAHAPIGILIGDAESRGNGLGAEAIAAVAAHGFEVLGLHKLTAGCYAPNEASRRAFLRAGFHVEAILRKHAKLDGAWIDVIEMARFSDQAEAPENT